MSGSVKKEIALSIRVAHFIADYQGYAIASTNKYSFGELVEDYFECDRLGILWDNPNAPLEKYFFGLIKCSPRRKFVGVLWLNNNAHCTGENKWFFEVYGKDELQEIEPMVNDLADHFNVEITLYLTQEERCFEQIDPAKCDY